MQHDGSSGVEIAFNCNRPHADISSMEPFPDAPPTPQKVALPLGQTVASGGEIGLPPLPTADLPPLPTGREEAMACRLELVELLGRQMPMGRVQRDGPLEEIPESGIRGGGTRTTRRDGNCVLKMAVALGVFSLPPTAGNVGCLWGSWAQMLCEEGLLER